VVGKRLLGTKKLFKEHMTIFSFPEIV